MKCRAILLLLLILVASSDGDESKQPGRRELTIWFIGQRPDQTLHVGEPITFSLYLRGSDDETPYDFQRLAVDDSRDHDHNATPNTDSANVELNVEQWRGEWIAIPFQARSHGTSASSKALGIYVKLLTDEQAESVVHNKAGKYRISATYTGLFKGRERVHITMPWKEILIAEDLGFFELRAIAAAGSETARRLPFPGHSLPQEDTILVEDTVLLDATALLFSAVQKTPRHTSAVLIQLTPAGTKRLAEITRKMLSNRLAIIIDGQVQAAEDIKAPIDSGSIVIDTNFSSIYVDALVDKLNHLQRP